MGDGRQGEVPNNQGRALILAGAGASYAIDSDKFPTTVGFFERLPKSVTDNELFRHVTAFLRRHKKTIDIEECLWELDVLRKHFSQSADANGLVGHLLRSGELSNLLKQGDNGQRAHSIATHAIGPISNLQSEINKQVYGLYSQEPTQEQLSGNWISLLNSLRKLRIHVDIATTNYDFVIESAIHYSGAAIETGEAGAVRRWLDLKKWNSTPNVSDSGLLTKLHGSLNWIRTEQGIEIGDPGFHNDHSRHAIIYPGFKGAVSEDPFRALHTWFEERLKAADYFLVIGFAFRDEYLNSIIERSTTTQMKTVVINPDESCSVRVSNFARVTRGFDSEAVSQFCRMITSQAEYDGVVSRG